MNTLEISRAKAKKMGDIEDMALDLVIEALKGTNPADSDEVKISMKTLAIVAKNRQTSTHREALDFGMATSIATPEGLKRYIGVSNPRVKKALAGKVI